MTLVCFDTETTGLDVQKEHIIQLSLVKIDTADWHVIDTRPRRGVHHPCGSRGGASYIQTLLVGERCLASFRL